MSQSTTRIVLVVFDGLRPDMVSAELMPRLSAFADAGCRFTRSRAVFPSETRVNQASLVTGCWPVRHGISGNKFVDPLSAGGRLLNSGNDDDLLLVDEAHGGKVLGVPSLGEILRAHGRQLAVVGSGTAGGTRLLHHSAQRHAECRFSLYRPDRSSSPQLVERILARFGPVPEVSVPCIERITYATDVFLDCVEPQLQPDVSIVWFFEPDYVYHYSGVGTPESLRALAHADAQFGRIVDWWQQGPRADGVQLLTLSDHGHVSTSGEPVNLLEALRDAGFAAGTAPGPGVDMLAFLSRVGAIDIAPHVNVTAGAVVEWLRAQSWCGAVASRDVPGTLPLSALNLDHANAPGIVFTTATRPGVNPHGRHGLALSGDAGLPPGAGNHGGLHPCEMNNWMAIGGSKFRAGTSIESPVGIVDVLPTMLESLALPVPAHVQGHVLHCALTGGAADAESEDSLLETPFERLHIATCGKRRYLDYAS